MLLIVLFSYNRAIQLDYLLKSIITRFKYPDYKIAIVYHTKGDHRKGYEKLMGKYANYDFITFIERKKRIWNVLDYIETFTDLKSIKRYLAHSYLRNKYPDNFKALLEGLLRKTACEFVMFSTDDGYFYDDVNIPSKVFDLIRSDPFQTSYRLYVGENLDGFPSYIHRGKDDFYIWDYYKTDGKPLTHWTYPFAVDGTVYHSKSIRKILKKVPYHNPITLEAYGVDYVIQNKKLRNGLGPIHSSLICTKLNRVSTSSLNPTININPDFLNSKFLDGYELELEIPVEIDNANIVPGKVFLIKDNIKSLIYELDNYGKRVQDALGTEGAKYQV